MFDMNDYEKSIAVYLTPLVFLLIAFAAFLSGDITLADLLLSELLALCLYELSKIRSKIASK